MTHQPQHFPPPREVAELLKGYRSARAERRELSVQAYLASLGISPCDPAYEGYVQALNEDNGPHVM